MVDIKNAARRLRLIDIATLTEDVDGKPVKLDFKQQEGTHTYVAKSPSDPRKAYLYSFDLTEFDIVDVNAVEIGVSTQKEVDAYEKKKQDDFDAANGIKQKPGQVVTGVNATGVEGGSKIDSVKTK